MYFADSPASYANFYIANQLVLAPIFGDPEDRVALNTLARLFPGSRSDLAFRAGIWFGLGTLHCMTQQQLYLKFRPPNSGAGKMPDCSVQMPSCSEAWIRAFKSAVPIPRPRARSAT